MHIRRTQQLTATLKATHQSENKGIRTNRVSPLDRVTTPVGSLTLRTGINAVGFFRIIGGSRLHDIDMSTDQ